MKRKRFIKLLMSKGVQRNEAALIAKEVREYGHVGLSYKTAIQGNPIAVKGDMYYYLDLSYVVFSDFLRRRNRYISKNRSRLLSEPLGSIIRRSRLIVSCGPRNDWWLRSPYSSGCAFCFSIL